MLQEIRDPQVLINSIMEELPQVPLIVNSVYKGIAIAEKYLTKVTRLYDTEDNMYLHALRVALRTAQYAKQTSNQMYFKYELIIIALLHDLLEDADSPEVQQDLQIFKSTNNNIMNGIISLTNDNVEIAGMGTGKYMGIKFTKLLKQDEDLFLVKLFDRLDNLISLPAIKKTELYNEDAEKGELFIRNYYLETQNIVLNLALAKMIIPDNIYMIYNELLLLLNSVSF